MWKIIPGAILLIGLGGCSGERVTTTTGLKYRVERVDHIDTSKIPQDADFKMADGDIAKYAIEQCNLNNDSKNASERCDVYAQPDPSHLLLGYVFVYKSGDGTHIKTSTSDCFIEGTVFDEGSNFETAVANPFEDFRGRQMYAVVERGPNDSLVSEVKSASDDVDENASIGVWYFNKEGEKLRITQERWNNCDIEGGAYVDEVFYRVLTLKR